MGMKSVVLILIYLFTMQGQPSSELSGTYTGLQEICTIKNGKKDCFTDPEYPKYKWYHLSELTFRDSVVSFAQFPVAIDGKDTIYSASDGGFYYYSGKYTENKDIVMIELQLTSCDYCTRSHPRKKSLKATRKGNDLLINNFLFTKKETGD